MEMQNICLICLCRKLSASRTTGPATFRAISLKVKCDQQKIVLSIITNFIFMKKHNILIKNKLIGRKVEAEGSIFVS